jgi:hypothetical protein
MIFSQKPVSTFPDHILGNHQASARQVTNKSGRRMGHRGWRRDPASAPDERADDGQPGFFD